MENDYDKAVIISGDSDLIPSIEAIKSSFPEKEIGIAIPINRRAKELMDICDFHMKVKEKHLKSSLFPKKIVLGDGKKIICPESWSLILTSLTAMVIILLMRVPVGRVYQVYFLGSFGGFGGAGISPSLTILKSE